jgi:hypothetical protein
MARTRTTDDLVADVRWQADVEGALQRHTTEKIVRALNQSNQAFRLMISSVSDYYLTYYDSGSAVPATTILAGESSVDFPADFVHLYGFDINYQGKPRELFPYQRSERNRYQDNWVTTGTPTYFREESNVIRFMPTADGSYDYRLLYLPTGDELDADTDFDGIAGWEDWLVFDSALRISTRDADVNDNYQYLQGELARIETRIKAEAGKRTVPKSGRRLDTRGRRQGVEWSNKWRVG